jgi:hypothetical protein
MVLLYLQPANGLVVQLVRMPPCHGGGRGFESRPVRRTGQIVDKIICPVFILWWIL